MILVMGVALIGLGLAAYATLPAYRRHRMTAELRRDWWPRFERDLLEYTSRRWSSAREAERRL